MRNLQFLLINLCYTLSFLFISTTTFAQLTSPMVINPLQTNLATLLPTPWVARHDLTSAQYQTEFNNLTAQGYRPKVVSGYAVNNQARYACIFEKPASTVPWIAYHGLTAADYQTKFNQHTAQGYRPVQVTGFALNNIPYFTVIFEKQTNPPQWVAHHGMTSADYQTKFTTYIGQGYRLIDVAGYTVNNIDYYVAIWDKSPSQQWVAHHGMTSADYQTKFNTYNSQGYRVQQVSGYTVNGQERYAAIWEKTGSGLFQARHSMSSGQYQDIFDNLYYQGYRPVWVNGYAVGTSAQFAALWESKSGFSATDMQNIDQAVQTYMAENNIPGLSFAITKNGKLVLAKGYGNADQSTSELVSPKDRFRIASVSKPITSVAIMKLIEQYPTKININSKVFGTGALLGTTYGNSTAYTDNLKNITVKHLLEHTQGAWDNDGDDGVGDPMFMNMSLTQAELISWTLNNQSFERAPGEDSQYSNFGYCLLGRIIEKVSGKTYEQYVQQNVLSPMGISQIEIGGNKLANRKPNEVVYYPTSDAYASYMNVERMDSHGGWIATPIDLVKFMVNVDGFTTVPDDISTTSFNTMITPWETGAGYAKGWGISGNNFGHNGAMSGTIAQLERRGDGYCFAVVVNTWPSSTDKYAGKMKQLLNNMINNVVAWPAYDLF
ncbi:MAG: serine hydrolase [Chitinophagales bacterium]|nr:serine hydrolase [Chitinophagales bacterium]